MEEQQHPGEKGHEKPRGEQGKGPEEEGRKEEGFEELAEEEPGCKEEEDQQPQWEAVCKSGHTDQTHHI